MIRTAAVVFALALMLALTPAAGAGLQAGASPEATAAPRQATAPPQANARAQATLAPPQANASPQATAAGKEILTRKCFQCHQASMWASVRGDRTAWLGVLYRMVGRGALWTEEEINAMATFLAETRGPVK